MDVRLCPWHEPHVPHNYPAELELGAPPVLVRCPGVRSVTRSLEAAEEVASLELNPAELYAEHTGRLELLKGAPGDYLGALEAEHGVTFGSPAWRGFVVGALWFGGPRRVRELLESPAELELVRRLIAEEVGR